MESIEIRIARDFSPTPGPRYIQEGKNSGEKFRREVLFPKVQEAIVGGINFIVDLDGTDGFGTSFLEESFGGLIRHEGLKYEDIISKMTLISNEEEYLKDDVYEYLKDAYEESEK